MSTRAACHSETVRVISVGACLVARVDGGLKVVTRKDSKWTLDVMATRLSSRC